MAEELQNVIERLQQVEKKVDEIIETAGVFRKNLVELAAREAERVKQALVEEARAWQDRLYAEEVARAEEMAKEIVAKGAWEVEKVRRRAAEVRSIAEDLVMKAVLGKR